MIHDYYVKSGSGVFESFSELMASGDDQYFGYLFSNSNLDSPEHGGHDVEQAQHNFGAEDGDGVDFLDLLDAEDGKKKRDQLVLSFRL